jgi:GMP reductase
MKIENEVKLDFSDVLIRPKRSTLSSRSEVDVEREFVFKHSKQVWKGIPIIVSNMTSVASIKMAQELSKYKVITCLHKYYSAEDIPDDLDRNYYAVSTGIGQKDLENLADIISKKDPYFICIDVPNGYCQKFVDTCKYIRETYPTKTLIAGNVVTREMVEELSINGGVDIIKIGIGSGAGCTTRLLTGCGMPQLSAVMETADAAHGLGTHIISDGGIVSIGDISKAFGAGADFVMMGGMFSGHEECDGEIIEENGKQYKYFYGMSSSMAMKKYHGGVAEYRSSEGRVLKVPYKGPVKNTILDILGGIRSCMTYIGAHKLKDIPKCTTFVRVHNQVNTSMTGYQTSYASR